MQKAIDVHAHMLCAEWLELFRKHSGARFTVEQAASGAEVIHFDGVPFMTPQKEMFDYPARIRDMQQAGVDMAILSLTGPNVYWGDAESSLRAARAINDSFADAADQYSDHLRWMASLPFQHPEAALSELARSVERGAVGVMVLANIGEKSLTDPLFGPIWAEIDRRALPVFMHPTVPCGCSLMDMVVFQLSASVGFPFDSTIAVSRMIYDGFFDRYPNLKLIVAHGGGALPFLAPRLDRCFEVNQACRAKISAPPSTYLSRIYADSVLYSFETLKFAIETFGHENILFGSDYPHRISDMVGTLARVDALEQPARDAVRGGNAKRVFSLNG
jgi:aminocarboxymuconate-semialdehyde decarboxylase